MLSRFINIKISKYFLSTLLINAWKVAGVLVNPNSITKYSKCSQRVRKTVFHLLFFLILIWLYAPGIFNLVNYFIFWSLSCNSEISSNKQLFFMVILFNSQQSIYNLSIPSFFGTKMIGYPTENINSQINSFYQFVFRYSLKALSLFVNREYISFLLRVFLGKSLIL